MSNLLQLSSSSTKKLEGHQIPNINNQDQNYLNRLNISGYIKMFIFELTCSPALITWDINFKSFQIYIINFQKHQNYFSRSRGLTIFEIQVLSYKSPLNS